MKQQLFKEYLIKYLWQPLLGIVISLLLTSIAWIFRELLIPSNILLIYLLGVFFVAIQFGLFSSIIASLSSAAAFAFFFAPPIFSLKIYDFDNLLGLSIMLVVAVMTSNLTENLRVKSKLIENKEHKASALYQLSKDLSEAKTEKEITISAVIHIYSEFKKLNIFLFPDNNGKLYYPNETPLNISLQGVDLNVANWVFNHGQLAGNNYETLPNELFSYLPLNCTLGTLGVLVIEAINLKTEQQQFFDTFIQQIINSIERAKLAEQAKEATVKMQTEALRNSLLSSISHDLRNPLAVIIGAANTLEIEDEQLTTQNRKKLAHAIGEEAQHISDLTTKILEMAKLEAGEVLLNKQWYTPEEIIGSALHCLNKKLQYRQINLHIAQNLALIYVDAVLLQQVIVNLIDNADKYSPVEQAIDIFVESSDLDLIISVADRGSSIPESLQEKIFDKFFQIHTESAQSGVGLGLSICRAIINAHGGEIHAINRKDGGLIIKFNLPVLESPPNMDLEE
jgi:two-component system sensor histidine kinase KdpD